MASGVKVCDESVDTYNELQKGKKLRFVIFRMVKDNTEIGVETTGERGADYQNFLDALKGDQSKRQPQCRYAVYDFEYTGTESAVTKNKVVFVSWAPEDASIKDKMLYASSRDGLKKKLNGIQVDVQATDHDEITFEVVKEKCLKASKA